MHREQILKAAEALFTEKGYAQTTIDDISKASAYSRRTIYAYYESKEDILHHIVKKGLAALKTRIEAAVSIQADFAARYYAVCDAIRRYQCECPHSAGSVQQAKPEQFVGSLSDTVQQILVLGDEINALLADFISEGQRDGAVRKELHPLMTVYVLWSSITALLDLVKTKGALLSAQLSVSEEEFLQYGFEQLLHSIVTTE